jgi:Ca2+-binding EF-hand superfamily protein
MRSRSGWGSASLICILLFASAAFPQSEKPAASPSGAWLNSASWAGISCIELFRGLDADRDGAVTRDEWERFFADHDDNRDGRLVLTEVQPTAAQEESVSPDAGRQAAFERLDTNKDGIVEKSEWPGNDKDFQLLDADHNGNLSREEFLARGGRWWNETFENLDFDGDKLIERTEWLDSDSSFNRLDRDRNGVIDRREFYNPR